MYRIVCSDGTVLYDQADLNGDRVLTEPTCSIEIGQNSSSLQFSMLPTHPAYDRIAAMKTYISAERDSEEIFYGRVTEIRTEKTTGVKQVACTGAMGFLDDFELEPLKGSEQEMSAADFFRYCINGYGEQLGNDDPNRALSVGTINHSKSAIRRTFGLSNYQKVKQAIDSFIIKEFGGYIRIRAEGGEHVVDWLENYGTSNASPIELANNVITHENAITSNDFFTVIHPLGKDGASLPEITVNVDDALVNEYGRIVKTVSFNEAKTAEDLRSEVTEYKTKMAKGLGKTCTVKLLDVHFLDSSVNHLELGAVYENIAGFENEGMTVFSMEMHFDNPAEDTVTLKNHRELTAVKNGSTTGKISKIISAAFENVHKHITETKEMLSIHADIIELHGISIRETAQEFERYSRATDSTIGEIMGTGVLQNSDRITQVAGNFTSKYSGVNPQRLSELESRGISPAGAGFYEIEAITITEDMIGSGIEVFGSPNGALNGNALDTKTLTVGQIVYRAKHTTDGSITPGKTYYSKTLSVGRGTEVTLSDDGQEINVYQSIDDVQENLLTITGSALWTQRDGITGVAGQFEIETDPETFERRLVVITGGGMKIRRNNVEYGLYDEYNLTGGLIVEKINDTGTQTRINGNKILVGDGQTQQVLTTALDSIEDVVGEFDIETDPTTGERTVVMKAGGGMKIRQNTTEFGIFHGGNLTGGVIVDTINGMGGSGTLTQIRGEFVDITADQVQVGSTSNVRAWLEQQGQDISTVQGLLADKATIAELNAAKARISTLETDKIDTGYLASNAISVLSLETNAIRGTTLTLTSSLHAGDCWFDNVLSNGNDISNPIVSGTVGGTNNDTLTLYRADGSTAVTFRKAASVTAHLVGSWSGNTYTVSADNDPNVLAVSTTLTASRGAGTTSGTWNVTSFDSNHRAYAAVAATGVTGNLFGFNIDATSEYNAGSTAGWNTGYDAARGYVGMPGSGTGTSFTVKVPNAARTGSENRTFTISKGTPSASGGYASVSYNNTAVARVSLNNWWTDGVNSVTVSQGGWENGANRVTASNGEYVDVTLPSFTASQDNSFTNHKKNVYFSTAAVTGALKTEEVDATSEYNAGSTAGYASAKLSGSWSGKRWLVTKGTTGTNQVGITLSATISYSTTTHKYTAKANADGTMIDSTDSGTQAYDAGWSGSYNAIGISATSSTATYGDTITVYARGKSSSSASAANVTSAKFEYTVPADRYNTGWSGCYGTVGLDSTTAKTLGYGEEITVYAQAKSSSGASTKTNVASRKITAPADRYTTGYNAGYNAGKTDGAAGVTISKVEQQGAITYSSGNYSVPVKATASNSNTGSGTITFAATTAYNAGWNACLAEIGIASGGDVTIGGSYYANLYTMGQSGPSRVGYGMVNYSSKKTVSPK